MYEEDDELVEDKGSLIKLIIIVNIILLIVAGGFLGYKFYGEKFKAENESSEKASSEVLEKKSANETLSEIKSIESKGEQEEIVKDYDFVHQMSNNLIIASDGEKWGEQDVTLENIDLGIEMLKDNEYIVQALNKWKEGDFTNAIEVHNYCWEILEGDKGKAIGIYQEGVNAALVAIGKE